MSTPPTSSTIPRIFVSHSHKDNAFCRPFVAHLRAALGLSDPDHIFYDETSLHIGQAWIERIQREVLDRPIFILILTPNSVVADYVRFETSIALRETVTHHERLLISLLAEECDPNTLAPALLSYQMADFAHRRYDLSFEELIAVLRGTSAQGAHAPRPVAFAGPAIPAAPDPRLARAQRLAAEARAAYDAGDFTDAYLKAEDALSVPAAATAELRALLAFAYAGAGQWQRARDAAKQALGEDADNVALWRTLATAHRHLNAPTDALTALDGARKAVPFSESATRLAILAERRAIETEQRQWLAAIATLLDELRLAPDDAARLETLADLQEKAGHPAEAVETLRRLTARPDAPASAWLARARLAISLKDAAEARAAFDAAARLTPNAPNDAALAPLRADLLALLAAQRAQLTTQSRWDDALAVLDQQLALTPNDADLLAERARLLLRAGRPADALAVARQLSERPNATVEDWLLRARALIALQHGGEAWQALVEAQRRFPQAAETAPARAALLALVRPLSEGQDASADQWLARARLAHGEGEVEESWKALLYAARLAPRDEAVPRERAALFPPAALPPRLAQLGFAGANRAGVQFILPPLCAVAAGPFLLGSDPRRDNQATADEQPQQRVELPAYQIARFPVTVAEYACFVRAGHAQPRDWQTQIGKLDHPVVTVSWHDAVAYAAWLAEVTGQSWRLPSEAEWEKAARGTDGRIYPWGNTFDKSRANTRESGINTTTPIGSYPTGASPYGAGDLAGNVWEWTASIHMPYPYSVNTGREVANSTETRVLRGGSWGLDSTYARAACRNHRRPDFLNELFGFRVALAAPGSAS